MFQKRKKKSFERTRPFPHLCNNAGRKTNHHLLHLVIILIMASVNIKSIKFETKRIWQDFITSIQFSTLIHFAFSSFLLSSPSHLLPRGLQNVWKTTSVMMTLTFSHKKLLCCGKPGENLPMNLLDLSLCNLYAFEIKEEVALQLFCGGGVVEISFG